MPLASGLQNRFVAPLVARTKGERPFQLIKKIKKKIWIYIDA